MARTAAALCAALLALLVTAIAGRLPVAAAAEDGLLRFAQLSPDTPAVDVSIQSAGEQTGQVIGDLGYGDVSGYRRLAPGSYAVAVRAAGSPTTTPPVLSTLVEVRPGAARTVAAAGRFDALALRVLDDDLSPPPPGQARVRVLGASTAAPLDLVLAGGPTLAQRLPFPGESDWTTVPGGPATVRVSASGRPPAQVPLTLAPGSVNTLLALDGPRGGVTLRQIVDAGAPAIVPAGPVPAGGGGTAGGIGDGGTGDGGTALALVVAAAVLAGLRRRSATRALLAMLTVAGAVVVPALPAPAAVPETPAARPLPAVAESAGGTPAPVRLQVPAVGIDTPLPALRLDASGTLVPPDDVATAGWFSEGPAPGDVGPAVVVGHVDSTAGPGVFFRLRDLRPGDAVTVQRADGSVVHFAVTRVARYSKAAFPSTAVYGPTPDAELRLVTCGGAFDPAARSYVDNVVVYARLG